MAYMQDLPCICEICSLSCGKCSVYVKSALYMWKVPSGYVESALQSYFVIKRGAVHFPMMAFLSALWASGMLKMVSHFHAIFIVLITCAVFAMLFEFPLKVYRKSILNIFPYLSQKCGIQP